MIIIIIITTLILFLVFISSQNNQVFYDYMEAKKVQFNMEMTTDAKCKDFISTMEKSITKPVCACKNVVHSKCRDNLPNYTPANDDEKKCVPFINQFKGNICDCMSNFHDKCQ